MEKVRLYNKWAAKMHGLEDLEFYTKPPSPTPDQMKMALSELLGREVWFVTYHFKVKSTSLPADAPFLVWVDGEWLIKPHITV